MISEDNKRLELCKICAITIFWFVLTTAKGIERLVHPDIWAEDGGVFLQQAFKIGWPSLFTPYDGYFHTVPRLIALASTWLPVNAIPSFIVLACYAVFACTISLLFTKPYQWLFRNKAYIFTAALLLLLSPGQMEMLGNVTNLHWYLLLLLSIIGLKDISLPYKMWELIIVSLCITTEGAIIILLPLFITRLILKWNKFRAQKYGEIFIILMICSFTVINLSISEGSHLAYTIPTYFSVFKNQFINFFIFHIFIGDHLTMELHNYKTLSLIVALATVFMSCLVLVKTWENSYLLIIVLSLSALLLPVMIAMARPMNIITLITFSYFNPYNWFQFRYSFFVPSVASIFWLFLISRVHHYKSIRFTMITVILFSQIFLNTHRVKIRKYTEPSEWPEKAELLKQSMITGCPKRVIIDINPAGWSFLFQTKVENNNCSKNGNK